MFHADLSQDLSLMLNDADDHNVTIQAGENKNVKEFHTHSNILRARSRVRFRLIGLPKRII